MKSCSSIPFGCTPHAGLRDGLILYACLDMIMKICTFVEMKFDFNRITAFECRNVAQSCHAYSVQNFCNNICSFIEFSRLLAGPRSAIGRAPDS